MRVWNLLHIVSRKGWLFWESNFFEENAQTFKKYYFNAIWKNTFFYKICTPWKCHRFFLWFGEYQLIRRFISDILFESQTTSQCQSDTEVQTRKKLRIKRRKKNSIVLNIFFVLDVSKSGKEQILRLWSLTWRTKVADPCFSNFYEPSVIN